MTGMRRVTPVCCIFLERTGSSEGDSGRSALGAVQPVADLSNNPGAVYSIGELFSDYSQEPPNHAEKVEQPAMTLKKKSLLSCRMPYYPGHYHDVPSII